MKDEFKMLVKNTNPLKETFGTLKNWKIDSQKLKDNLRKKWSKN